MRMCIGIIEKVNQALKDRQKMKMMRERQPRMIVNEREERQQGDADGIEFEEVVFSPFHRKHGNKEGGGSGKGDSRLESSPLSHFWGPSRSSNTGSGPNTTGQPTASRAHADVHNSKRGPPFTTASTSSSAEEGESTQGLTVRLSAAAGVETPSSVFAPSLPHSESRTADGSDAV
mmetsp:Transcript_30780/g.80608  ORF Transcript_30780/g.80608 Transcript_30780/m.80608 type:complete len:175 (-) Transcript_30780:1015-1539(-)